MVWVVEVVLSRILNSTWEWDAATRSFQADEIAEHGLLSYYFGPAANGVWLPLWQVLLALLHRLTGFQSLFLGEMVSAAAAGVTGAYVVCFARRGGVSVSRLATVLLLSSGCFAAYASQAMTESLSVALFVASLFHLSEFLRRPASARHLVAASAAMFFHAMTRYEGWIVAVLVGTYLAFRPAMGPAAGIPLRRSVLGAIAAAGPTLAFAAVWCGYNYVVTGHADGYSRWVFENNDHEGFFFFHSVPGTLFLLLRCLLMSCGLLWIYLAGDPFHGSPTWNAHSQEDSRIFALMGVGLSVFFVWSAFWGYNSGWDRHLLYLHPLSVIAAVRTGPSRARNAFIAFTVVLGAVSFGDSLVRHARYVDSGRWPGNAPLKPSSQ